MASLASLPVELQCRYVQYLDIITIKRLRLVSKTISGMIGAEQFFKTIVLKFTAESCERFTNVLEDDKLKLLVKAIIIDGQDGNKYEERNDDNERSDTPWSLVIPKISQFPALKVVELWLDDECGVEPHEFWRESPKQDEDYRRIYHDLLFNALENAPLVDSLVVKHLQDALIACKPSREVQQRLKSLALMIVTETDSAAPENDLQQFSAIHECFNSGLSQHWLQPMQTQLTHLTIYCDREWGVRPFTDLRSIHFSHLKSLALGNLTIAYDWQIDWITSHGETLTELVLDCCPIVYLCLDMFDEWSDEDQVRIKEYSTRWSDVFPLFQQRLQHLKHFGMVSGSFYRINFDNRYGLPARFLELHEDSSYATYQSGIGPSPFTDGLISEGKDPNKIELEDKNGDFHEIKSPGEEQYKKDKDALRDYLEVLQANGKEQ